MSTQSTSMASQPDLTSMKEKAIAVYNQEWKNHPYSRFLEKATMADLGKSQYSFYHAVEAFPRMLALLASKIVTNENRKLVVTNLFEEHGKGENEGFHTESFRQFLTALGMDLTHLYNTEHEWFNPGPSRWIRGVADFITHHSAAEGAAYLSGIEYLYAGISADIAQAVVKHPLQAPQSHYSVHAELDWEHGAELMQVAYMLHACPAQLIEDGEGDDEYLAWAFEKGMSEFLELYADMVLPLEEEVAPLATLPISFFFTREDPAFTAAVVKAVHEAAGHVSAVAIASGGETIASLLKTTRSLGQVDDLAYVDMNPRQLDLCHAKENWQGHAEYLRLYGEHIDTEDYYNTEGKFEALFAILRQYFETYRKAFTSPNAMKNNHSLLTAVPFKYNCIYQHEAKAKLRFILGQLFSNKFLATVFTDQATAYTSDSFSKHFFKKFVALSTKKQGFGMENFRNIFLGVPISYPIEHEDKKPTGALGRDYCSMDHALQANPECNYIDMSNIGDWMPVEEFKRLLKKAYHNCTHTKNQYDPNKLGVIVVRKLLGDYSLHQLVQNAGFKVISCTYNSHSEFYDHSEFYSEVIIGVTTHLNEPDE